jgi:hypothetical protein
MRSLAIMITTVALAVTMPAATVHRAPADEVPDLVRMNAPILVFHEGEGGQCCYPSDAEQAFAAGYDSQTGKLHLGEVREPKSLIPGTPCYYQVFTQPGLCRLCGEMRIKYWFWYNYNDFPQCADVGGSHVGDWESVEVVLTNGEPFTYMLSNHDGCILVWLCDAIMEDGHIKVWVGKGSHANYPSPDYDVYCWEHLCCDEVADSNSVWHTEDTLKLIDDTNFAGYTGKWGDPVSPVARQFENYVAEEWFLVLWAFDEDFTLCTSFEAGHEIAFLTGVKISPVCPDGGFIRFAGEPGASTLISAYTQRYQPRSGQPRIQICDGAIRVYNSGVITFGQ